MAGEPALAVTISRQDDDLLWEVENVGPRDVWAFLLVPSIVDGRLSFAVDTAWIEQEDDGTLLVRKVNAQPPAGHLTDPVLSGAVHMRPGDRQRGRVTLGREVSPRPPYTAAGQPVVVRRVALEVGWVPWRKEAPPELLNWQGRAFAYVEGSEEYPQESARSEPLEWAR